jgi:hypothetical protein
MPPITDEEAAALKKANEELLASSTAVANKNKELLNEKKKWGTERQFLADKLGVDLADPDAIETTAEALARMRETGGGGGDEGKGKGKSGKDAAEKMRADFAAQLAQRDAALLAERERANAEMVRSAISEAVIAAGGDAETLAPFVKMSVRVAETDGKFALQVVDADGTERLVGAKSMTVAQYVEQLRADKRFGSMFKASGAAGSGSTGAGQRPNTSGEKSSLDKISSGLSKLLPGR